MIMCLPHLIRMSLPAQHWNSFSVGSHEESASIFLYFPFRPYNMSVFMVSCLHAIPQPGYFLQSFELISSYDRRARCTQLCSQMLARLQLSRTSPSVLLLRRCNAFPLHNSYQGLFHSYIAFHLNGKVQLQSHVKLTFLFSSYRCNCLVTLPQFRRSLIWRCHSCIVMVSSVLCNYLNILQSFYVVVGRRQLHFFVFIPISRRLLIFRSVLILLWFFSAMQFKILFRVWHFCVGLKVEWMRSPTNFCESSVVLKADI